MGERKKHKDMRKRIQARKRVESRLLHSKNEKNSLESAISGCEARLACLDDPAWITRFIEGEKRSATLRMEGHLEDRISIRAEIAGLQIEIARRKAEEA